MMDWKKIFSNPFKKKKAVETITDKDRENFAKIILDRQSPTKNKKPKYVAPTSYEIQGHVFKIGDKIISRSNEPDPLLIGTIIEFWDNEGKWTSPIPQVKEFRTGKIWGTMGVIEHYSDALHSKLREMKPLEQWNFLVSEEHRYTEEEIKRKEDNYLKRKLPKKK